MTQHPLVKVVCRSVGDDDKRSRRCLLFDRWTLGCPTGLPRGVQDTGRVCHRQSITMHIIIPSYSTARWSRRVGRREVVRQSDTPYTATIRACHVGSSMVGVADKNRLYTVIFLGPKSNGFARLVKFGKTVEAGAVAVSDFGRCKMDQVVDPRDEPSERSSEVLRARSLTNYSSG